MTTTITKPRKEIEVSDLLEWAKGLPRETRNPVRTDPPSPFAVDKKATRCAYVGADGAHCIAGEFFSDHGITNGELSLVEGVSAARVALDNGFNGEVADALNFMQTVADASTRAAHEWGYKTNPWGCAVDQLEKYAEEKRKSQSDEILVSLAEWKPLNLVGSL